MMRIFLMWFVGLAMVGCTSMNTRNEDRTKNSGSPADSSMPTMPGMEVSTETSSSDLPQNVRLAQAQVWSETGEMIKGTFNFEQMPNSVIVTYRLEGLTPKREYQIFVKEQNDCRTFDQSSAVGLKDIRATKQGISENTFKLEDFSVSAKQPLLGKSVVVATRASTPDHTRSPLACGQVLPLVPTAPTVE